MNRDVYLRYIVHFIERVDQLATTQQYKTLFLKYLGKEMFAASDLKLKTLARHLKKAHIASTIIKYPAYYLAFHLSDDELTKMIDDLRKVIAKYKLYEALEYDTSIAVLDKGIERDSSGAKKTALKAFEDEEAPVKKPRAPAKRAKKAKTPVRQPAKKPAAAKKAQAAKKPSVTAARRAPAPVKTQAKKAGAAAKKKCSDYTISELRAEAKTKKIPYSTYGKMTREALCKRLGKI